MLQSNSHIHTPYSFCCFDSVEQPAKLAREQGVDVLGINDFNTVEGFAEFDAACRQHRVYPLFNIEFIALSREDKDAKKRWNDKNPGIIYFCGKGLDCPSSFSKDARNILGSIWKATQDQIWQVINAVNDHLESVKIPLSLDYNRIRTAYARYTVRERHVTKAIYHEMQSRYAAGGELSAAYRTLFKDAAFSGNVNDAVMMQNEIRNRLLKAGKPCFVDEKPDAFLPLPEVVRLILDGGGIPCYPILIDDSGPLNEYENDPAALADRLKAMNIHAVEFIPLRNGFDLLKRYAVFLHNRNLCVTFGTEHNTPEMLPMAPATRGGVPLDEELRAINYRGACIIAAHQEQRKMNRSGFVGRKGERLAAPKNMDEFVRLGDAAIRARVV